MPRLPLIGLLALLLGGPLPAAPPAKPGAASPVAASGAFTGLVAIGGGRRLWLQCRGQGHPTVLLEAGLNDGAAVWSAVQDTVAPTTRVCSYDRANVPGGASDPAPGGLRPAAALVADLHALLTAAAVPAPYVLVGHSVGGLFVRLFAAAYPDEVVGMVLVDATHEDYYARLAALVGPEQWAALRDQFAQAVAQGVLEPVDLDDVAAQVKAARRASPLRSMPLVVLSHARPPATGPLPNWPIAAEERLWGALQDDLARLVPHSRHVLAEGSGHDIQRERPDLVPAAIRQVVEAVRRPGAWATPSAGTPDADVSAPASAGTQASAPR